MTNSNTILFIILERVHSIFAIILPLLIAVAYLTLAERKIMAGMQQRRGPSIVGYVGVLQPLADGLKLFLKETILPSSANTIIFILAPILTFMLALLSWAVIPFSETSVFADINIAIIYIFAISSTGVYGIIGAGWASNAKYSFLGALRSAAQMISYEVSMGLILLCVLVCVGSLSLIEVVLAQIHIWYVIPLYPLFLMFLISTLAETNRAPFDLPEAEAELVSGYNVEYSGMGFALFFLGEYANMILMSALTTVFFLGGWLPPFSILPFTLIPGEIWFGLKVTSILFFFIWVRAAFPRYRYDQLMALGWKVFLPLSLAWLLFVTGILVFFNGV